jgi:hypothetical protein
LNLKVIQRKRDFWAARNSKSIRTQNNFIVSSAALLKLCFTSAKTVKYEMYSDFLIPLQPSSLCFG